jgi:hypothetical protein
VFAATGKSLGETEPDQTAGDHQEEKDEWVDVDSSDMLQRETIVGILNVKQTAAEGFKRCRKLTVSVPRCSPWMYVSGDDLYDESPAQDVKYVSLPADAQVHRLYSPLPPELPICETSVCRHPFILSDFSGREAGAASQLFASGHRADR